MIRGHAAALFLAGNILLLVMLGSVRAENLVSDPVDSPELPLIYTGHGYTGAESEYTTITTGNTLREESGESTNSVIDSVNGNQGIISINQSAGNLNNQSNVRVVSPSSSLSAVTEIQAGGYNALSTNKLESTGGIKRDLIEGSFQDNVGIMGINQSAGSCNQQSNSVALAVGGGVSLTEAELGDLRVFNNDSEQEPGEAHDIINNSFFNSEGVFQVTQSAGNMNILKNNLGISIKEINLR